MQNYQAALRWFKVPNSSSPVTTTDLSPAHAPLIAVLHAQCFDDAWDEASLYSMMSQPSFLGFVMSIDEPEMANPVGFLLCQRALDEAEILTIGVLPEHRGRGLAKILLQHASQVLRAEMTRALFLDVGATNRAALALYQTAGFEQVAVRPNYYKTAHKNEDALVLKLDLTQKRP
jgi:ribosomal-protein-alanine acetyltransferase